MKNGMKKSKHTGVSMTWVNPSLYHVTSGMWSHVSGPGTKHTLNLSLSSMDFLRGIRKSERGKEKGWKCGSMEGKH